MKKKDFEDDGRQVADMSSIDKSWYGLRMHGGIPRKKKAVPSAEKPAHEVEPELTKKETRQVIANAILAALLLGSIFIGAAFLFLLFLTKVWLK
ncbi:MAG: hypothetical protein JXN65_01630 [Clostridia bacterium]|nr:hypothetical protein [Clostridia bacterium]